MPAARLELHLWADGLGHRIATQRWYLLWRLITFALGAAFLALELREFSNMIAIGASQISTAPTCSLVTAGPAREGGRNALRCGRAMAIMLENSRSSRAKNARRVRT